MLIDESQPNPQSAVRNPSSREPGRWTTGDLPANIGISPNTVIAGGYAFNRFHSQRDPALTIGDGSIVGERSVVRVDVIPQVLVVGDAAPCHAPVYAQGVKYDS